MASIISCHRRSACGAGSVDLSGPFCPIKLVRYKRTAQTITPKTVSARPLLANSNTEKHDQANCDNQKDDSEAGVSPSANSIYEPDNEIGQHDDDKQSSGKFDHFGIPFELSDIFNVHFTERFQTIGVTTDAATGLTHSIHVVFHIDLSHFREYDVSFLFFGLWIAPL